MARQGRDFELAYEWLYDLDEKYKVTSPAYLYDKAAGINREVDVLVEYEDENGLNRKMSIECRDRNHAENVMWIEQLIQKREDLELDYIVATTTHSFSKAAINKAKYHGVIIESAELVSSKTIDDTARVFNLDVFFFKFEMVSCNIVLKNKEKITFSEYLSRLSFVRKTQVLNEFNTTLYFGIEPHHLMEQCKVETKDFFSNDDNSIMINDNSISTNFPIPKFMDDVIFFDWEIRVVPFKLTLPLSDSISVFDGESHANKDYKAIYGNDEDYFRIGYLNGKLFTEIKFKHRDYLRFAGMNLDLNTIIPDETDTTAMDQSAYIMENLIGKFDFTKIL